MLIRSIDSFEDYYQIRKLIQDSEERASKRQADVDSLEYENLSKKQKMKPAHTIINTETAAIKANESKIFDLNLQILSDLDLAKQLNQKVTLYHAQIDSGIINVNIYNINLILIKG